VPTSGHPGVPTVLGRPNDQGACLTGGPGHRDAGGGNPRQAQTARTKPLVCSRSSGVITRSGCASATCSSQCFQNSASVSVREIVVQRLTENQGADWWEKAAPKAVKDRVNQRRDKEAKNRWHVQRGANEIYYTDFGGLLLLIQSNLARLQGPVS
jgi:hypothetical protein